ncbi:hypothetical protein RSSM_00321 [Rhodopirellula sallentina SM41]|uniref:Uncharacterized protein n=1 Tax=Rhodopirellula sallentina SM41 TaxID=1263870 RepID=M5UK81_9BACT|nr:hypothetical protein RSSM_00321 [Rhodopirellula sallentina SM41]
MLRLLGSDLGPPQHQSCDLDREICSNALRGANMPTRNRAFVVVVKPLSKFNTLLTYGIPVAWPRRCKRRLCRFCGCDV